MVYMEKRFIQPRNSGGWLSVTGEGSESDADVYVQTSGGGASLSKADAFRFIKLVARGAGLRTGTTGARGELIVTKPESEAVLKRRDELAKEFDESSYDNCYSGLKNAINYIVDAELKEGELA